MHAIGLMLAFSLTITADAPKNDDAAKKEEVAKTLKLLEGDWKALSFQSNGEAVKSPENFVLSFRGDQLEFDNKKLKIKIDPTKKPMHFDMTIQRDGASVTFEGIYRIDGDELKLCHFLGVTSIDGKRQEQPPRPESFDTKDTEYTTLTLKRVKK